MFSSNATQVSTAANYIEDCFSTWIYTGNETARTIANGIDLSTKGGLVWCKSRNTVSTSWHNLFDTARGNNQAIYTNETSASVDYGSGAWSPATTGFNLGDAISAPALPNRIGDNYCSWTFRKQPKFFDVVTYTGDSVTSTFAHNLGSVPGCIIVKRISSGGTNWQVYHRSSAKVGFTAAQSALKLNTIDAVTDDNVWNNTAPTSTQFTVRVGSASVNANAETYVAYLFAHDAGGFGLTGADNVISCGSYTGNGSATGPVVTLGYEPQWLMIKNSSDDGNWQIMDNMRGMPVGSADATLQANLTSFETSVEYVSPNASGFQITSTNTQVNANANTYIYIAIRRGPMKVPTTGTSVFNPTKSADANGTQITTNFAVDSQWINYLDGTPTNTAFNDRLRGVSTTSTESGRYLASSSTAAEATALAYTNNWGSSGFLIPSATAFGNTVYYSFRRAPGFFDEVCYTGTGTTNRTLNHGLTVVPELMIVKERSAANRWCVYSVTIGYTNSLYLNATNSSVSTGDFQSTPTSTTFSVTQLFNGLNNVNSNYVAYLFASCPGVSKVGSYTGNGSTQTIDCGFTGGSRMVLIKRTDSTGNWVIWDTARGMVAGTDPRLELNTTNAETNANWIYTTSGGFQIVTSDATVNASGGSYIFLSIS
jgi:hypothetical protein